MKRLACIAFCCAMALPVAARVPVKSYGQELVDEAVAANPDLLVAMMHVTPPDERDNVIIASNIGRFGKKADEDDMRVIDTGRSNLEVAAGGTRFEVELVLQDAAGRTIGALGLVFPYREGADKTALERHAQQIRDTMRRHIDDVSALVETFPADPTMTTRSHGARLVEQALVRHPETLAVVVHAAPPGRQQSVIVASSTGHLGNASGESEQQVLRSCKGQVRTDGARHRVEVLRCLQDATGKSVGVLATSFAAVAGEPEAAFERRAETIGDELRKGIASIENLVSLDP